MKIIVFAYKLVVSGTTVNSVELTAALRDCHGFDVALFATPGPLAGLVEQKRLRYYPAPEAHFHPSPARMSALRDAVRRERPEMIYAWDWPQAIDAFYGVYLPLRIPTVVTDMSMALGRMLPRSLPTTFGTPAVRDQAAAAGRRRVEVLLPPIDTDLNAPGAVDPSSFREYCGIKNGEVTLVTVSRLDEHMKSESITRTIEVTRVLGRELPVRSVIVGDGSARAALSKLADEVNAELGRPAVLLPGAMVDPRPAYAAADIVVGMGGSALRGMAFGKPVIVTGARGFSSVLNPKTADYFLYYGMYGYGDGDAADTAFVRRIRSLVEHPEEFAELGDFSRRLVLKRFSLNTVSGQLAEFCRSAASSMPTRQAVVFDALRTAAVWVRERRFIPPSGTPAIQFMPEPTATS
jgi:glycosyltransferase involved in cell wall biosynthesis